MTLASFARVTRVITCALALPSFASAATISTIATIPRVIEGSYPNSGLTKLGDMYYGTTVNGGASSTDAGTVYRIDLRTGADTVLYSFNGTTDGKNPVGELTVLGGKLYGTTQEGGSHGGGTVFAIDPATGAEQVIYDLPADTYSRYGLTVFHGLLYGTGEACGTSNVGCIFAIDPVAATGQVVYSFGDLSHGEPLGLAGLTQHGGGLYGTTGLAGDHGGGTLFRFDPASATVRFEHQFGAGRDGTDPMATLLDVGGVLYGTTGSGGAHNDGTVFAFDPGARHVTILHEFDRTDGGPVDTELTSANGLLYGVTSHAVSSGPSVLFSVDPATGQTTVIRDLDDTGSQSSSVIEVGGLLYGTGSGGADYVGVVYSVDPATGTLAVVHSFAGQGVFPTFGLIKVGASLYGTTYAGGSGDLGSIYKVDPATGALETVYSFTGADGARPNGRLVDVAGVLYGVTRYGGSDNVGTVFGFDPHGRRLTTLYQFTAGTDGRFPAGTLSVDNQVLYGAAATDSSSLNETVFALDLASGTLKTVFHSTSGVTELTGVTAVDGLLYGVASGVLFRLDPATGKKITLHTFTGGTGGVRPVDELLFSNGSLFGVTLHEKGSPSVVFSYDLATATETTVHVLQGSATAQGPLVEVGSKLFGTTTASASAPYGAVLKVDTIGKGASLYPFPTAAGGYPLSPLLHVGRSFYGTTSSSAVDNAGTVFEFTP